MEYNALLLVNERTKMAESSRQRANVTMRPRHTEGGRTFADSTRSIQLAGASGSRRSRERPVNAATEQARRHTRDEIGRAKPAGGHLPTTDRSAGVPVGRRAGLSRVWAKEDCLDRRKYGCKRARNAGGLGRRKKARALSSDTGRAREAAAEQSDSISD